jgi:hypothetical protein
LNELNEFEKINGKVFLESNSFNSFNELNELNKLNGKSI